MVGGIACLLVVLMLVSWFMRRSARYETFHASSDNFDSEGKRISRLVDPMMGGGGFLVPIGVPS